MDILTSHPMCELNTDLVIFQRIHSESVGVSGHHETKPGNKQPKRTNRKGHVHRWQKKCIMRFNSKRLSGQTISRNSKSLVFFRDQITNHDVLLPEHSS